MVMGLICWWLGRKICGYRIFYFIRNSHKYMVVSWIMCLESQVCHIENFNSQLQLFLASLLTANKWKGKARFSSVTVVSHNIVRNLRGFSVLFLLPNTRSIIKMNLQGRQGSSLKMLGIVKELSLILICLQIKCLNKNVSYIYQLILLSLTASVSFFYRFIFW